MLLGRKTITNLDSILKSRNITLPTKVHIVKTMVFPIVMYGCESWTIKTGLLTPSSGLFLFSQLPESWGTLWGDWRSLFPSSPAWLGPLWPCRFKWCCGHLAHLPGGGGQADTPVATELWSHLPRLSMELLRLNCVVTYLGRSPVWVALGVLPVPLRGAQNA